MRGPAGAHGEVHPATVTADAEGLTARLHKPAYGVAAGQALVVYAPDAAGDTVIASGTIDATEAVDAAETAGV